MDNTFVISTRIDLTGMARDAVQLRQKILELRQQIEQGLSGQLLATPQANLINLSKAIQDGTVRFGDMGRAAGGAGVHVDGVNTRLRGTSNALSDVGRRVFVWGALSAAIFGYLQNLKEAYSLTLKIDTAMAELHKVFPKSADFAFVKNQSFEFSIKYGAKVTDTLEIMKRFAQAGLNVAQALRATETALLAMNTTGADTEESINAIIGANKIFNVEFENSARIIDKIQRVQADFAVDAKDLVTSITAIGPAITAVGGNIDDLFSLIAGMGEAARISGKEASNALKRVLSRITTKEGIDVLQNLGVQVMATADSYRPLMDILKDLGTAFDGATQVEKQQAAVILAQVRQFPKFIAMYQNWMRVIEANEKSQNAFGDALEANEYVMATYEKRIASATAKTDRFYESMMGSGGIANTITSFKELWGSILGEATPGIAQGLGAIVTTVGLIGVGIFFARKAMLGFNAEIVKAGKSMGVLSLIAGRFQGQNAALLASNVSVASRWVAGIGLVGVALLALSPVISAVIKKVQKTDNLIKSFREEITKTIGLMDKVEIPGIDVSDTDRKFKVINQTFSDLRKNVEDGTVKLENVAKVFAETLTGEKFELIKQEQINQLITATENLQSMYANLFKLSIGEDLGTAVKTIREAFQGAQVDIMKGKDAADEYFDAVKKIALRKEFKLGFGIGTEWKYGAITEGNGALTASNVAAVKKLTDEYTESINKYIEAKELLAEAKLAPGSQGEEIASENAKQKLDDVAASILKMIDVQKLFNDVAEKAGYAHLISGVATGNLQIDAMTEAIDRAGKMLQEQLISKLKESGASAEEVATMVGFLDEALKQLKESGKLDGGVWVNTFTATGLLSTIKESSAAIISTLKGQIDVIDILENKLKSLGMTYDGTAEKLKAVQHTMDAVLAKQLDNTKKLTEVRMQREALSKILKLGGEGREPDAPVELVMEPTGMEDFRNKLNDLITRETVLVKIIEDENKNFDKQVEILAQILALQKKVETGRKTEFMQFEKIVGANKSLLEYQIKIAELGAFNKFEAVRRSATYYRQILDEELKIVDAKVASNQLDKEAAVLERQKLIDAYELAGLNTVLEASYDGIKTQVGYINSAMDGVRSSVRGLFMDTESWLESLADPHDDLKMFENFFNGIVDSVASAQSDLIADYLSQHINNTVLRLQEEKDKIIEGLNDPTLAEGIKDKIIGAGHSMADETKKAIIDGWETVETTVLPGLLQQMEALGEQIISSSFLKNLILEVNKSTTEQMANLLRAAGAKVPEDVVEGNKEEISGKMAALIKKVGVEQDAGLLNSLSTMESTLGTEVINTEEIKNKIDILIAVAATKLGETADASDAAAEATEKQKEFMKKQFIQALSLRLSGMLSQAIGAKLAASMGKGTEGVGILGGLGLMVGSQLGGPFGGAAGQFIGSVFGSLFGSSKKEEETHENIREIARNTAAMVERLSPEIINAPANFVLPRGYGAGQSVQITNNITVTGGSLPSSVTQTLVDQLNEAYNIGTRTSTILE